MQQCGTVPGDHKMQVSQRPGRHLHSLFLLAVLLLLSVPAFAQVSDTRGLQTVVAKLGGENAVVGKQYAVLIAIDKYSNWISLTNPVRDAREIRDILYRRYYITDVLELYDASATKAGIIRLFTRLINTARPEDSVFIFYAGHGYLDKTSNTGFWIPVDGGLDLEAQDNWLPNGQIRGFISNLKARHVALVADSCFSGDILNPSRGVTPTISDEYFKNAYSRISRQVLTSGASESVPDKSPFTQQLKLALEGNTAPYLDPLMLYSQIRLGVTGTTPLFGDLKDSGHQEGSSFLFFLKSAVDSRNPPKDDGPASTMKIAKAYGTATIAADAAGTLFLDGVSQGQIPRGSVATIENLAIGSHEVELRYDDGTRSTQTVIVKLGKDSAVEFSRPVAGPPAASTTPPQTLLDGKALPAAAIKVDGNVDDWQGIPAVSVGSPGRDDNKTIRGVWLASDAENLFIRLDIADKTPISFFHAHNFDESPGGQAEGGTTGPGRFYAVRIDRGDGGLDINVLLFHTSSHNLSGWHTGFGAREKATLRFVGTMTAGLEPVQFQMKGSSVEMTLPMRKFQDYLVEIGQAPRYRVTGWTGRGTKPLEDLRETQPGYFTLQPVSLTPPQSGAKPPEEVFDSLMAFGGHQYYISRSPATWTDANTLCQKYGGHLATITSDAENKAVLQALQQRNIARNVWIGLTKVNGNWRWVTGERLEFTYWHTGQPDNNQGDQNDAQIWLGTSPWLKQPGKWDDQRYYEPSLFILEME